MDVCTKFHDLFKELHPFAYKAFAVSGKVGSPLTGLTIPVTWI